ncbi:TPA: hypothetical protein ACPZEG_001325 [Yersinia enterocolitica]
MTQDAEAFHARLGALRHQTASHAFSYWHAAPHGWLNVLIFQVFTVQLYPQP